MPTIIWIAFFFNVYKYVTSDDDPIDAVCLLNSKKSQSISLNYPKNWIVFDEFKLSSNINIFLLLLLFADFEMMMSEI